MLSHNPVQSQVLLIELAVLLFIHRQFYSVGRAEWIDGQEADNDDLDSVTDFTNWEFGLFNRRSMRELLCSGVLSTLGYETPVVWAKSFWAHWIGRRIWPPTFILWLLSARQRAYTRRRIQHSRLKCMYISTKRKVLNWKGSRAKLHVFYDVSLLSSSLAENHLYRCRPVKSVADWRCVRPDSK